MLPYLRSRPGGRGPYLRSTPGGLGLHLRSQLLPFWPKNNRRPYTNNGDGDADAEGCKEAFLFGTGVLAGRA